MSSKTAKSNKEKDCFLSYQKDNNVSFRVNLKEVNDFPEDLLINYCDSNVNIFEVEVQVLIPLKIIHASVSI